MNPVYAPLAEELHQRIRAVIAEAFRRLPEDQAVLFVAEVVASLNPADEE